MELEIGQIDPRSVGLNEEQRNEYHRQLEEGNRLAYQERQMREGRQEPFIRIDDDNDDDDIEPYDEDELERRIASLNNNNENIRQQGGRRRKQTKKRKASKRRYGGTSAQQVVNIQGNRNNHGVQPLPPELLEPEQMDGEQLIQRRYRDQPFYRPEVDDQVRLPPLPNFNYPPPPVPQGWPVQPTAPDISEMVTNRQVGGKRKHTRRTRHVKKYLRKGRRTLRLGKSKKALKRKN
jgi:hypothetical protein